MNWKRIVGHAVALPVLTTAGSFTETIDTLLSTTDSVTQLNHPFENESEEERLLGYVDEAFALTINFDQATRIREKI